MIRKLCRSLLLRWVVLALTGDQAASVLEEPMEGPKPGAAVSAAAAHRMVGAGWEGLLLPGAAYQVVSGAGFQAQP